MMELAKRRASAFSSFRIQYAIRWADLGPTPGRRSSSSSSFCIADEAFTGSQLPHTWDVETAGNGAHAGTAHLVISENIFENRFMFASELNRMGSRIAVEGHHALVQGVSKLEGAPVSSPDLRGGAALVIAGLAAEGETVVHDIHHIDRGYEDYVGKLHAIGANVERKTL